AEGSRHVVETEGRIVRRQELCRTDLDIQQITNNVRVFPAIDPMRRNRLQIGFRVPVEFPLQKLDHGLSTCRPRLWCTDRLHHSAAKPSHDLFPRFPVSLNVRKIWGVQSEARSSVGSGRRGILGVAARTILLDEGARCFYRRPSWLLPAFRALLAE